MSSSNIKFQTHLTIKLSGNVFYPHKSRCKPQNMLKTVLPIIFFNCSPKFFFESSNSNKKFLLKRLIETVVLAEVRSTLKVTPFSFNILPFVRKTISIKKRLLPQSNN